jgi:hypothetical protein
MAAPTGRAEFGRRSFFADRITTKNPPWAFCPGGILCCAPSGEVPCRSPYALRAPPKGGKHPYGIMILLAGEAGEQGGAARPLFPCSPVAIIFRFRPVKVGHPSALRSAALVQVPTLSLTGLHLFCVCLNYI